MTFCLFKCYISTSGKSVIHVQHAWPTTESSIQFRTCRTMRIVLSLRMHVNVTQRLWVLRTMKTYDVHNACYAYKLPIAHVLEFIVTTMILTYQLTAPPFITAVTTSTGNSIAPDRGGDTPTIVTAKLARRASCMVNQYDVYRSITDEMSFRKGLPSMQSPLRYCTVKLARSASCMVNQYDVYRSITDEMSFRKGLPSNHHSGTVQ